MERLFVSKFSLKYLILLSVYFSTFQGKFRVDLRGTQFVVSPGVLWTSVGNDAVHRVDISAVISPEIFHFSLCSYIGSVCLLIFDMNNIWGRFFGSLCQWRRHAR